MLACTGRIEVILSWVTLDQEEIILTVACSPSSIDSHYLFSSQLQEATQSCVRRTSATAGVIKFTISLATSIAPYVLCKIKHNSDSVQNKDNCPPENPSMPVYS
jgi:hypothetical protein